LVCAAFIDLHGLHKGPCKSLPPDGQRLRPIFM
jgi:hypothetical protein